MQQQPNLPAGLPEPHPDALRHSERVASHIREHIAACGGRVSFGDFMQQALYAPGLGYYAAGAAKFGPAGDFVTAPELSPLFGRVLARQCAQLLAGQPGAAILELGAGSGALAISILQRLAELDCLPGQYMILEVSADLAERQRQKIEAELGALASRVLWLPALPPAFSGVIVANEVLDALPVERFERRAGDVLQQFVTVEQGSFRSEWHAAGAALTDYVRSIEADLGRALPEGYRSEASLGLAAWLGDVLGSLQDGVCLLIDYGVTRREYYAGDRGQGWLRCHFRHHAHSEPLIYPGIQDLTSWVDFSAVAAAAAGAGAELAGFVTQAMFLLNGGLDNEFAGFEARSVQEQMELTRQVKLLTLPGEMGENFKSMALVKGNASVPDAFRFQDRAHTL